MQRCLTILAVAVMALAVGAPGGGNGNGKKKTKAIELSASDPLECAGGSTGVPAGSILVGHDASQCFTYTITVPAHAALEDAVAKETVNSNFDMSPEGESEAEGGSFGSIADEDAATGGGDGGVTAATEDAADASNEDLATSIKEEDCLSDAGGCDGFSDDGTLDGNDTTGSFAGVHDYRTDNACVDATTGVSTGPCDTNNLCTDGATDGSTSTCDGNYADGICDDGVCDGVDLANCADGTCDGVKVTLGACGPTYLSQPDSADKNNNGAIPPKQPEMIVFDLDGEACDVQVWVKTVGNPGNVTKDADKDPQCVFPDSSVGDCILEGDPDQVVLFDVYEPAKCSPLREFTRDPDSPLDGIITTTGGLPIVDYVAINLGAKAFEGDTGDLILLGNDFVAALPSAELKPDGCDTDGDDEPDVTDFAPLDPDIQDAP